MIQMYHVDMRYAGGMYAVRDVSLAIDRGEFLFVTGPSGAGKSTVLRMLFAAEQPSAGQIMVAGRNISRIGTRGTAELRRKIGFIFQDFKLLHDRSVFENIAVALEIAGAPRSEIRARVWSVVKRLGLGHRLDHRPRALSGGEQQRVAIARALVAEPPIVLADEPTGNLDPDLSLEIMDILADANTRGATVIVATHDPKLLERYRFRHVTLDSGRLIADRRPELVRPEIGGGMRLEPAARRWT
jgi:cell division transport system ATP-binding protein